MIKYFEKVTRGTAQEDSLMIAQHLKGMIGKQFAFLNYYKEIPVSYDAVLKSVENDMAEFELHEYQAKAIHLERRALIQAPEKGPFPNDLIGEVFYVNIAKKTAILCKFAYAKIFSDMRRFVRVMIDRPVEIDLQAGEEVLTGRVRDISLGGVAISLDACDKLQAGMELKVTVRLPDVNTGSISCVGAATKVVKILDEASPPTVFLEFVPEKHSQQQISYYINQRQVQIIKELKDLKM